MIKLNEPFRDNVIDELVYDPPVDDSDPDLPPPPDGGRTDDQDQNDNGPDGIIWDIDSASLPAAAKGDDDDIEDEIIWDVVGGTVTELSSHYNEVDQLVDNLPVDDSDPDLPPPPDGGRTRGDDDGVDDIVLVDILGPTADFFEFASRDSLQSDAEISRDEQFTLNFEMLDFDASASDAPAEDVFVDHSVVVGDQVYDQSVEIDYLI